MTDRDDQSAASFIREEGAERIISAAGDEVVRNLLRLCVAEVRMRGMKVHGMTADEWRARLPVAPLDMEFLTSVLEAVFSRRHVIESLLAGKSIAEATGWDDGEHE